MQYSIEPTTRKCVEGYEFLSFARNFSSKYRKKIIGCKPKYSKNCYQKDVHIAEATG